MKVKATTKVKPPKPTYWKRDIEEFLARCPKDDTWYDRAIARLFLLYLAEGGVRYESDSALLGRLIGTLVKEYTEHIVVLDRKRRKK